MAACPRCHKRIDRLVNWTLEKTPYVMRLRNGEAEYEPHPTLKAMSLGEKTYDCPHCYEELFRDEESALAFLATQARETKKDKKGVIK